MLELLTGMVCRQLHHRVQACLRTSTFLVDGIRNVECPNSLVLYSLNPLRLTFFTGNWVPVMSCLGVFLGFK
jgi:hypothetical protein